MGRDMHGGKDALLRMALDMICSEYIADPDAPEESKVELRILMELKELDSLIRKIADYAEPEMNMERLRAKYPVRKEVYEYLALVRAGMAAFLEEHPLPKDLK